jgi:hypothetical protein
MDNKPKITLAEAKTILDASCHAPRVTEESINAKIASVGYHRDAHTTICVITMNNGFRFIGTSTPAAPENYVAEIGERYAYDNAYKQIWTHEGYLLRELLSQQI